MGVCSPYHCDSSGAHHFLHPKWAEDFDEVFDFGWGAAHFDDHGVDANIDDFGVEDAGEGNDFVAVCGWCVDFCHDHFTFDDRVVGDISDFEDFDEPIKLFDDLFNVFCFDDECHAADAGYFAMPDGEAFDVESAPTKEADASAEDAWAILYECDDGVFFVAQGCAPCPCRDVRF